MISSEVFARKSGFGRWFRRSKPKVLAVFSFRYDVHLVPAMIENVTPMVDGWVSFDDRASPEVVSLEPARRTALIHAAHELGAEWILAIDPDERYEKRLATRIKDLIGRPEPTAWAFELREMYTPDSYRVDGVWGKKHQYRLIPTLAAMTVNYGPLHTSWCPKETPVARKRSKLNLYHLKMIVPERRVARRDLYRHMDPGNAYQAIGYDYLADETGVVLETIPKGRGYHPPHHEDGGLWMPPIETVIAAST